MNKIALKQNVLRSLDSDYLRWARELMSENRWSHTLGVLNNIDRLLDSYAQLDPFREQLLLAGLLHDVGKDLPLNQQKQLAGQLQNGLDEIEQQLPAIWHGPAAARLVLSEFNLKTADPLIEAIALHSTGASTKHTICDALVVADFSAPDRDFSEAGQIRDKISKLPFNRLVHETIRYKLLECLDNFKLIHPRSLEAYNRLCE